MTNRIDKTLKELMDKNRKGLFPFLVAGQPDLDTMKRLIKEFAAIGVSGIELGFPFTDPVADGPVIQSAFTESLEKGTTVSGIMNAIREIRSSVEIPIIAMVSASIVYKIGTDTFFKQAKDAGFDGFIIPDLSLEEAPAIAKKVSDLDMRLSMLVAPNTPADRQKKIAQSAGGFIYYMSIAGITGERDKLPENLPQNVAFLKSIAKIPVLVGFGIKTPPQVKLVCSVADGAIVGSAIVRKISELNQQGKTGDDLVRCATDYVKELLSGTES